MKHREKILRYDFSSNDKSSLESLQKHSKLRRLKHAHSKVKRLEHMPSLEFLQKHSKMRKLKYAKQQKRKRSNANRYLKYKNVVFNNRNSISKNLHHRRMLGILDSFQKELTAKKRKLIYRKNNAYNKLDLETEWLLTASIASHVEQYVKNIKADFDSCGAMVLCAAREKYGLVDEDKIRDKISQMKVSDLLSLILSSRMVDENTASKLYNRQLWVAQEKMILDDLEMSVVVNFKLPDNKLLAGNIIFMIAPDITPAKSERQLFVDSLINRIKPLLLHASNKARRNGRKAWVSIPNLFIAKQMNEDDRRFLDEALFDAVHHVILSNKESFDNLACVAVDVSSTDISPQNVQYHNGVGYCYTSNGERHRKEDVQCIRLLIPSMQKRLYAGDSAKDLGFSRYVHEYFVVNPTLSMHGPGDRSFVKKISDCVACSDFLPKAARLNDTQIWHSYESGAIHLYPKHSHNGWEKYANEIAKNLCIDSKEKIDMADLMHKSPDMSSTEEKNVVKAVMMQTNYMVFHLFVQVCDILDYNTERRVLTSDYINDLHALRIDLARFIVDINALNTNSLVDAATIKKLESRLQIFQDKFDGLDMSIDMPKNRERDSASVTAFSDSEKAELMQIKNEALQLINVIFERIINSADLDFVSELSRLCTDVIMFVSDIDGQFVDSIGSSRTKLQIFMDMFSEKKMMQKRNGSALDELVSDISDKFLDYEKDALSELDSVMGSHDYAAKADELYYGFLEIIQQLNGKNFTDQDSYNGLKNVMIYNANSYCEALKQLLIQFDEYKYDHRLAFDTLKFFAREHKLYKYFARHGLSCKDLDIEFEHDFDDVYSISDNDIYKRIKGLFAVGNDDEKYFIKCLFSKHTKDAADTSQHSKIRNMLALINDKFTNHTMYKYVLSKKIKQLYSMVISDINNQIQSLEAAPLSQTMAQATVALHDMLLCAEQLVGDLDYLGRSSDCNLYFENGIMLNFRLAKGLIELLRSTGDFISSSTYQKHFDVKEDIGVLSEACVDYVCSRSIASRLSAANNLYDGFVVYKKMLDRCVDRNRESKSRDKDDYISRSDSDYVFDDDARDLNDRKIGYMFNDANASRLPQHGEANSKTI
ncbi:hypothetical protein [Candidatus Xenohaliotis californiensis]